ncbi:MAG: guanylate kinase [Ferrovum myxofaciens]|uniref:Guanylate kinase n=2 Tax=root TaxID=1 RepID=A0A8F3DZN8_9PROT|nr:guanylate kinase [Ferrovum myxofaciens]NDU90658.1 guanylate kinase [Ferrovum sp.]MBU6994822.1 guanylate kinase [Ferrovum myxofaciens]QKE39775.1 MAG: guanylate kinase [Ferrovum myxofaciens]QKE42319.1 MAG: guanylate kinase [Ferrovum myxofaciens]
MSDTDPSLPGQLFIVTAPSGAGKSSLIAALLKQDPRVRLSVSHTTRAPRLGEVEGQDYHFVSPAAFLALRTENQFLEWAEVYGNFYGTTRQSLEDLQNQGFDVILEIDWQGARQVRQLYPESLGVFILPPSLETLRNRLQGRGKDDPATIEMRLSLAQDDLSHENEFEYAIINADFDEALRDLAAILRAARCRRACQYPRYASLLTR